MSLDKKFLEAQTFYENKISELEAKLAEKEEENLALAHIITGWDGYNQEEIDFAIEQLEKVKGKLLEELQNVTDLLDPLEYEDYHEFIGCGRGYKNSIEEIDNQIKQLKEMK